MCNICVTFDKESERVCDLFWFCAVASHFSFSDLQMRKIVTSFQQ